MQNQNPIQFSVGALQEIVRLQQTIDSKASPFLRIGVKGGGCSGLSYLLAFDKEEPGDNHYTIQNIPVVINKAHVMYIVGMEIDWENGLNNRGFEFKNPNATETCGCGQSFNA